MTAEDRRILNAQTLLIIELVRGVRADARAREDGLEVRYESPDSIEGEARSVVEKRRAEEDARLDALETLVKQRQAWDEERGISGWPM